MQLIFIIIVTKMLRYCTSPVWKAALFHCGVVGHSPTALKASSATGGAEVSLTSCKTRVFYMFQNTIQTPYICFHTMTPETQKSWNKQDVYTGKKVL